MSTAVDEKAGWCGNCRAETHGLCASVTCACPSKGRRNHPLRKSAIRSAESVTTPPPAGSAAITPLRPQEKAAKPKARKVAKRVAPPSANGSRRVSLAVTSDVAALIVRALRYTVGEGDGGVGVECFEDEERSEMLRCASAIEDAT